MKLKNLFFLAGLSLMALPSCNKSDLTDTTTAVETTTIEKTIDLVVTQGAKSTVVLPASTSGYQIATDAAYSTSSMITTNESGNQVYEYTAPADYAGADAIVLTSTDTTACAPPKGGGGCHGHNDNNSGNTNSAAPKQVKQTKLKINVTVVSSTAAS